MACSLYLSPLSQLGWLAAMEKRRTVVGRAGDISAVEFPRKRKVQLVFRAHWVPGGGGQRVEARRTTRLEGGPGGRRSNDLDGGAKSGRWPAKRRYRR